MISVKASCRELTPGGCIGHFVALKQDCVGCTISNGCRFATAKNLDIGMDNRTLSQIKKAIRQAQEESVGEYKPVFCALLKLQDDPERVEWNGKAFQFRNVNDVFATLLVSEWISISIKLRKKTFKLRVKRSSSDVPRILSFINANK